MVFCEKIAILPRRVFIISHMVMIPHPTFFSGLYGSAHASQLQIWGGGGGGGICIGITISQAFQPNVLIVIYLRQGIQREEKRDD